MAPLTAIQLQRFANVAAQSLIAQVRIGARFGRFAGFALAALFLLVAVLSGTPGRIVTSHGSVASVTALVLGFLGAGPLSGATFGALFPLMRRDVGAVLVGTLAAAPVSFALTTAFEGSFTKWGPATYVMALIMTGLYGWGGFVLRELAITPAEELTDGGDHDPAA